jgi:hypothetical protein
MLGLGCAQAVGAHQALKLVDMRSRMPVQLAYQWQSWSSRHTSEWGQSTCVSVGERKGGGKRCQKSLSQCRRCSSQRGSAWDVLTLTLIGRAKLAHVWGQQRLEGWRVPMHARVGLSRANMCVVLKMCAYTCSSLSRCGSRECCLHASTVCVCVCVCVGVLSCVCVRDVLARVRACK